MFVVVGGRPCGGSGGPQHISTNCHNSTAPNVVGASLGRLGVYLSQFGHCYSSVFTAGRVDILASGQVTRSNLTKAAVGRVDHQRWWCTTRGRASVASLPGS